MKIVDLRSDTVTKPSTGMLQAMMKAEVGDDVFGEDPTVKKLEAMAAGLAGMEAAVYAPSGTQTNLMALMAHCQRGDEYIVGQTAHNYMSEGGGAAVLGSVQPQPLDPESDGTLNLSKVAAAIKPIDDHYARTKLFCLENTINGKVLPLAYLEQASEFCERRGLLRHLDGARAYNAAVKLGVDLGKITRHFNSVSICLSKGLGAPMGSVLCGSEETIKRARRWRKVLGGGMRQVGIMAAAGIYALENNVQRLAEDHSNALRLAQGLAEIDEIEVDLESLQTNIFFIRVNERFVDLHAHLRAAGVLLFLGTNPAGMVRVVTHLDITASDVDRVINEVKGFFRRR